MYEVINFHEYTKGMNEAIHYYHSKWGNEKNYRFFHDAIIHSAKKQTGLPRFYLLLAEESVIGCCGLVINDFISRHDLFPWLAGLFVEDAYRGHSLGNKLMQFAELDAVKAGYKAVYLTTDHDGFYEKYGWQRIEDGYEPSGQATRIYRKILK